MIKNTSEEREKQVCRKNTGKSRREKVTSKIERKISNIPVIKKHITARVWKRNISIQLFLSSSLLLLDTSTLILLILHISLSSFSLTPFFSLENQKLHFYTFSRFRCSTSWAGNKRNKFQTILLPRSFFFSSHFFLISFHSNSIFKSLALIDNKNILFLFWNIYSIFYPTKFHQKWTLKLAKISAMRVEPDWMTFLPVISECFFPFSHFSPGFTCWIFSSLFQPRWIPFDPVVGRKSR